MSKVLKLIFFPFLAIQSSHLICNAQVPPPPPPIIYKAPDTSSFKIYVADDNSFQATFPGSPTVTEKTLDDGVLFKMYFVYGSGYYTFIKVTDTHTSLKGREDKIYDYLRKNYLKNPKSKIELEKDITLEGVEGKEFSILKDYNYLKTRVFIKDTRVIELENSVTNWHIISEKIKEDYLDETERFFNSFKFLKE